MFLSFYMCEARIKVIIESLGSINRYFQYTSHYCNVWSNRLGEKYGSEISLPYFIFLLSKVSKG